MNRIFILWLVKPFISNQWSTNDHPFFMKVLAHLAVLLYIFKYLTICLNLPLLYKQPHGFSLKERKDLNLLTHICISINTGVLRAQYINWLISVITSFNFLGKLLLCLGSRTKSKRLIAALINNKNIFSFPLFSMYLGKEHFVVFHAFSLFFILNRNFKFYPYIFIVLSSKIRNYWLFCS